MESIDWRVHIHADPAIMVGKPVLRGTRLTVEFVLRLFAAGWTHTEIFENSPRLTEESLRAVAAYPSDMGHSDR